MAGTVTLIGSGESASIGGKVFDSRAQQLPPPLNISVLETPAGYETNSSRVAGRIVSYLATRLQNYQPKINQIAARQKSTPFSPDSPEIVRPLFESNLIFIGPGSPTYTVRQLKDSLAWQVVQARHRLGADLVMASAATIAVGVFALPVYEIYKVGEDPHWKPGLDLFGPYGLSLAIIPHWNNNEGGDDVDTSRCFIGQERFDLLLGQLPSQVTVVGVDEHTALTIDLDAQICRVEGRGFVHLLRGSNQEHCSAGCEYPITYLGDYRPLAAPESGLPLSVWQQALEAAALNRETAQPEIPPHVQQMVEAREEARSLRQWSQADEIRDEIAKLGWRVSDSPAGPQLHQID